MSLLGLAMAFALARACAPSVAPDTLVAVAAAESALNPLAIGINGPSEERPAPRSRREAVAIARRLVREGRNIDVGLAQLNVRTLRRLHLSLEDAFDPCRNLAAAGVVLRENFRTALRTAAPGVALRRALSLYNTGKPTRGLWNGYVRRVEIAAQRMQSDLDREQVAEPWVVERRPPPATQAPARRPTLDVFTRGERGDGPDPILVFS